LSDIIPSGPFPRPLPFRRPADYYAAPLIEVRPLFPRWVPVGCGTASLIVLILLFLGGALAGGGRGGALFAMLFGTMRGEIHGMFTKDVTPAQKAAFDAEIRLLQKNLDQGKISVDKLQPLLRAVREVSADQRVTPQETERLIVAAREVNRSSKR